MSPLKPNVSEASATAKIVVAAATAATAAAHVPFATAAPTVIATAKVTNPEDFRDFFNFLIKNGVKYLSL